MRLWAWRPAWLLVGCAVGPAILLARPEDRAAVILPVAGSLLLGYLVLRLLGSGLLTEPGWRRPPKRLWGRRASPARREYLVPAQLPPAPGPVIGRDAEVRRIVEYLQQPPRDSVRTVLVTGPPGVGKSSLAMGAAQLSADTYRDGQLLVHMDPLTSDEKIIEILRSFVLALQGPNHTVPDDEEAVLRRYGEVTRGRRVLVLLEGASDVDQVRQLLPHGRGCAAIVTSRHAWPDASPNPNWLLVHLDPLSPDAAHRVLEALIGQERLAGDPEAARHLVRAAAGNPFALQIVGAALADRPLWTVRRMAEAPLASAYRHGLPDYTHAIDIGYAMLTEQERRCLTLLGLLEETPIAGWELGALLRGADPAHETAEAVAARALDRLTAARLVDRRVDDVTGSPTFRVPDQLHEYVRARLHADIDRDVHHRAFESWRAERRIRGERDPEAMRVGVYRALNAGELSAALGSAHELWDRCVEQRRTAGVGSRRGPWHAEENLALVALAEVHAELGWLEQARWYAESACSGDSICRARALRCLGLVNRRLHKLHDAIDCLTHAEAAVGASDSDELVRILRDRALVHALRNEPDRAWRSIGRAEELRTATASDRASLPSLLWAKGGILYGAYQYGEAEETLAWAEEVAADPQLGQGLWLPWIAHQRALVAIAIGQPSRGRALAIRASDGFAEMRHRYGIAHCRLAIGRALLTEGRHTVATTALEEALQTFADCGDPWSEAYTRLLLAQALLETGWLDEATTPLVQAAQRFDELGDLARLDSARTLLRFVEREQREVASGRSRLALQSAGRLKEG